MDIVKRINQSGQNLIVGLAGPGTGKSTAFGTLIQSEEFSGKKTLILSFINKLVDDLARDFQDYDNVEVSTLHSFALTEYKKHKGGNIRFEHSLDNLVDEDHSYINGSRNSYVEKIYNDDLCKEEEEFHRNRQSFYNTRKETVHSFNSIIYYINRLFENDESKIPSDYELILVDEFQDFNKLESNLIHLLSKKNRTVVVGDDDQSLYYRKNAKPESIRGLYQDDAVEKFTLDYCFRCPKVIVDSVNSLIENVQKAGILVDRVGDKNFLYPPHHTEEKHKISAQYPKIEFLPAVDGEKLIYELYKRIINDAESNTSKALVISPSYLMPNIHEGLTRKGFNIVEYSMFSNEKRRHIKHSELVEIFEILTKRKTDNLALRKILPYLYIKQNEMEDLIKQCDKNKSSIWDLIESDTKRKIESDIEVFKKAKKGQKDLTKEELNRINEMFNLKNIISKVIKGFHATPKDALEVELATPMSSKGLSADFVYYIGIDDKDMLDNTTATPTDQKVCEFLVGMTRAKRKLTLISKKDKTPKILNYINPTYISIDK